MAAEEKEETKEGRKESCSGKKESGGVISPSSYLLPHQSNRDHGLSMYVTSRAGVSAGLGGGDRIGTSNQAGQAHTHGVSSR